MIAAREVVAFLGAEPIVMRPDQGDLEHLVLDRAVPLAEAGPGALSFCGSTAKQPQDLLARTHAGMLIVERSIPLDRDALAQAGVAVVVLSDNARLDFIRVIERFFAAPRPTGIHPSAVIAPSAVLAPDVFVGPLCSIGAQVEIGAGAVIFAGVHIYDRVRIGRNVTIHAGTVIGADGFGYERNAEGALEKFPHLGGVVIEDEVEIGANTCIDRGALSDTRICQGARIDNLVHIAHNVHIGRHAAVIAHAMIGGGTHIGDYAWIAPSACVRDRIKIGAQVVVGLGALVTKDLPDGVTVAGAPARELAEQKRLLAHWAEVAQTK